MPRRPCIEAGCPNTTTGTRCAQHEQAHNQRRWVAKGGRYNQEWRRISRTAIASHLATHGPICPGWQRPAHLVDPAAFVCDHDVGPLCRDCNGTKAGGFDKRRGNS